MPKNLPIIQEPAANVRFDDSLFEGDPEFLTEIVNLFLATCPELLSAVETAVLRKDADGVYRAAHTLKGAVANFGADEVVAQAKALETMGRSGDISHAAGAWQSLRALVVAFEPVLKAAAETAAGQVLR